MAQTRSDLLSRVARGAVAAAAAGALNLPARAQDSSVVITGRGLGASSVTGFGDATPARSPLVASSYGTQRLLDADVSAIGGLPKLSASVGDSYNAEGYWSIISVRGYTLDNRFNYRRDGLPINAETAIALDNKERMDLLEGTSGIQAGTSAPGGLVNLVVKHATGTVRTARLEARQPADWLAAVDLGDRFGPDGRIGLRLNLAHEKLDPQAHDARGERTLVAFATDWQLGPDTLLQAEYESSRQTQPSVTGFSMLGNVVPAASSIDPRLNLNHQPWGQPVVLDGNTGSLRLQQRLAEGWSLTLHAMQQRLKSDDRTAFPYGVYDATTYQCPQWCDRFAPDGTFTYWQYISDNERRTSTDLALTLQGQARSGAVQHALEAGVLQTRYRGRFQDEIYDIAGTGRVDGSLQTPPSPGGTTPNTDRDERSTEVFVRDAMRLGERWQLWAGLRQTRLDRASVLTSPAADGLEATSYRQSVTVPWLALMVEIAPRTLLYSSWGQGIESDVAPSRPIYTNPGQALPALKSRQFEVGVKHEERAFDAALTLFDIDRPQSADIGSCDAPDTCAHQIDGSERHIGAEASSTVRLGPWQWQASAMTLDATRRGSSQPDVNGHRPVNVPRNTLRLGAEYQVPGAPGLALLASLSAESDRVVLPYADSVRVPGWSRIDLSMRWRQALGRTTLVWRAGVDNAGDRRAWKESPYEFSHVYLYPLAPRTLRASVQASF